MSNLECGRNIVSSAGAEQEGEGAGETPLKGGEKRPGDPDAQSAAKRPKPGAEQAPSDSEYSEEVQEPIQGNASWKGSKLSFTMAAHEKANKKFPPQKVILANLGGKVAPVGGSAVPSTKGCSAGCEIG